MWSPGEGRGVSCYCLHCAPPRRPLGPRRQPVLEPRPPRGGANGGPRVRRAERGLAWYFRAIAEERGVEERLERKCFLGWRAFSLDPVGWDQVRLGCSEAGIAVVLNYRFSNFVWGELDGF